MNNGFVYLVGAGPGDVELITKKGYDLIEKCEVLIYDRLISTELINHANNDCEKIYVGKVVGNHAIKQEEINEIIVKKALENKFVVRLKGGDPFVFGRGGEEILELEKNKIPYKVVPGVTSAISGLAYAGIPITHRGVSRGFHVITGHSNDENSTIPNNLDILAKLGETLVFLMGFSNLKEIVNGLLDNGKDKNTPVAIICNATTDYQMDVRGTLETIVDLSEKSKLKAPALIVVGGVSSIDFRTKDNILSGINVGITGTKDLLKKQRNQLEYLGANVYELCNFDVMYMEDEDFINAINTIYKYQWIIFTSANSVKATFRKIAELDIDLRNLYCVKFAVVGSGTAEILKNYGFKADFIPTHYSSKCLANELSKKLTENDLVFIPRAKKCSKDLKEIFTKNKINFDEKIVYDITLSEKNIIDLSKLDIITFGCSTAVKEFLTGNPINDIINCKMVCIGEQTKKELEKSGLNVTKTEQSDVNGLIKTIVEMVGNYDKKNS